MRQSYANPVTLFASLVVLVTIAIHSANGLPIDANRRQEIVLSFGDGSDGNASAASKADKPSRSTDFDATASPPANGEANAVPVPQIGKLLITPAAVSVASDPMASWSGPMIGSGKFNPMPLIAQAAVQQSTAADDASVADKSADAAPPVAAAAADATKNGTAAITPPDADKLKEISTALAKAEDESRAAADAAKTGVAASVPPQTNATTPGDAPKDPAAPPNRRSVLMQKRTSAATVTKRSAKLTTRSTDDNASCPADQDVQTFVPVTYTELRLIKLGQYKVQQTNAPANATDSTCGEGKVLLVPVSEEAMTALQQDFLQLTSAGTESTVILETVEEAKSASDQAANSTNGTTEGQQKADAAVSTPGPMYSVVPIDDSKSATESADKQLRIKLEGWADSIDSTQRKRQSINRRQFSVANVEHAGPTVIKRSLADHFTVLEKRVKPSSADNTSLFGNGKGKLKYGHKISYNAGVSDVTTRSTSFVATFAVFSIFALAGDFQS